MEQLQNHLPVGQWRFIWAARKRWFWISCINQDRGPITEWVGIPWDPFPSPGWRALPSVQHTSIGSRWWGCGQRQWTHPERKLVRKVWLPAFLGGLFRWAGHRVALPLHGIHQWRRWAPYKFKHCWPLTLWYLPAEIPLMALMHWKWKAVCKINDY